MFELEHRPKFIEFAGTPEAGKTTTIRGVADHLRKESEVQIIRESAEIVPSVFPKGCYAANLWMRLNSLNKILETMYKPCDYVLVDRGFFDAIFWMSMYRDKIPEEHYMKTIQFIESMKIKPDLLLCFTCSPETSIQRRGGEGRIVTLNFVERYNATLNDCYDVYDGLKEKINTDYFSVKGQISATIDFIESLL